MQFTSSRSSFLGLALAAFCLQLAGCTDGLDGVHEEPLPGEEDLAIGKGDGASSALWTYYAVTRVEGGALWVKRLSQPDTKCADGKWKSECKISEIDWSRSGLSASETRGADDKARARRSLMRGKVMLRNHDSAAVLQVTETWESADVDVVAGIVVRAIASTPCDGSTCSAVSGTRLNKGGQSTATYARVSGLTTAAARAELAGDDGVLLGGVASGTGADKSFAASQVWRRRGQSDSESERTDATMCSANALATFPKDELRIHVIDVGQGDAIFVQTPWKSSRSESTSVLIDAGASGEMPGASPGGEIVVSYLLEAGFEVGDVLDALVVTHAHDDHFGGVERVAESFGIARYTDPGFSAGSDAFLDARRAARDDVEEHEGHMNVPALGELVPRMYADTDLFGGRVDSTLLWGLERPKGGNATNPTGPDVNNTSIAMALRYGGRQVLLMGDVESAVEAALIEAHDAGEIDLAASVLKVAHHGSSRSTSSEFLQRVFANKGADSFAIISSGRRTFTGSYLPTEATIDRLRAALPEKHLLSTENRDQHKVVGSEHGDDNVLVRIKASGAVSVCYLP